jgi:protein TonB
MPRPPRLARWLLLLIPALDREFIEGDLEEEYAGRLPLGRTRAAAWYWRQVLATLPPVCTHAALEWLRKALTDTAHPRRIPMALPTSSTTPRTPAFGSRLLASRPPRARGQLATNLVSLILHGGIVGGLVYSTMDQGLIADPEEVQIFEVQSDMFQPPPPPPPPVEAAAAPSLGPPVNLTPPDVIPPEIPPPGRDRITAEQIYEWTRRAGPDTTADRSERVVDPGSTPTFTPFTVPPVMRNLDEVAAALEREYPPLLRDAGVGGRVEVWIRLDERGAVQDAQVNVSSGHPALDESALRVARIIEFSAAMNRDKAVPVWVSIPITFQVR